MTIRQQIVLLTSGVVFVLGLILIVFINLIAPIFITHEVGVPDTQILINTIDEEGNPSLVMVETPGPSGYTIYRVTRKDPLVVIRVFSMIGLAAITGLGYYASKWVAQKSLNPINYISQTAQQISANNLDQRLNYQGTQDEVKILADAFDLMLQRLENNFEDQSEFISNLAHELRTPLTSLRMNLEVLNVDPQATLEEYQIFSGTAERALNRLERLVEDFLLLAKGEKEITLNSILLGVLLEEILDELAPIAEEHNVSLKISRGFDLSISCDPILLHRAISNLIENGILYNHAGGNVEISSRCDHNQVVIEIKDDGIGIPVEQQNHIFDRFYRVNEISNINNRGKGLGLAITAHIIRLHNGQIKIKSVPGRGSTFTLIIPQKQISLLP